MTSRNPRVLLLFSDALYRAVLMRAFIREGWDVAESSHSQDAERRAVQFQPHVLLVEQETLSEMLALLKHWKTLPTLTRTRVIVEVNNLVPGEAEQLFAGGAAMVVVRGHQTPQDIVHCAAKEL